MCSIQIRDYDVDFPYPQPYDIQKSYMEKVIDCLHNRNHGVLESPTGTGKTLCLLAPVSAWMRKQKSNVQKSATKECYDIADSPDSPGDASQDPKKWGNKKKSKVWYTARTHSQIAQTVSEVRKCNIEGLNIRVMGARDQLCINSDVLSEPNSYIKTIKCKELTKAKGCKHYLKLNHEKDVGKYYRSGEVLDIEDLVSVGKTCGVCPYFLSKNAIETADIILLPYNYVIDKDSREANGFQFQGDVVIFDEGHNVPNTCEESYEFSFTSVDIGLGIRNMKELMTVLARMGEVAVEDDEMDIAMHAQNAIFMVEVLQKLETGLEKFDVSDELLPVSKFYSFFEEAGITSRTSTQLLKSIEDFKSDSSKLSLTGSTLSTFNLLEKMMNTIFGSTVKSFDEETINRSFKCAVSLDPDRVNKCKKVDLFCFNPSFGIRAILQLGVSSIVITSGTLSPLRNFIYELNLPKPLTLQNGHIAKKSQVPFLIVGTGVNSVRMDGSYNNRTNSQYVFSLGMTLTNLVSSVPDGVLVLFSSYTMMQNLREAWESDVGVWKRLNALKRVFVEPRGKEDFINCMENYKRAIDSGNGAILMGVLRGKISEGMDFKDQYCRGVFIIGVPFPPTKDLRVKGKERYAESLRFFDPRTKTEQKLYSNSFMSVEAMRATNQAIGRVIRHGHDYGAIVLVDYRFSWPRLFQNTSSWLRGEKPVERNFAQAKKILGEFFRDAYSGKLGVPEVRVQRADGNGCPVAGYVTYEEYEHKKAVRKAAPWISAQVAREKSASRSAIEFADDAPEDGDDIASLYARSQPRGDEDGGGDGKGKSNSVFDALTSTKSLCSLFAEEARSGVVGEGEEEEEEQQQGGTAKRKLEESAFAGAASTKATARKVPRLKVKPFFRFEGEREPESVSEEADFRGGLGNRLGARKSTKAKAKATREESEKALKDKLTEYFKMAKGVLSRDEDEEFRKRSFRYMKSEMSLAEMLAFMNAFLTDTEEKATIFEGFSVCVKSKDKEEWERARLKRKLPDESV